MNIRCWEELKRYGALDVLSKEYGSLLKSEAETEHGYNVSLEIDIETLPEEAGKPILCTSFARNIC